MRKLRVYADTSVFGGCLDEEFALDSRRFLKSVRNGRLILLMGEVIIRELDAAPEQILQLVESIPPETIEPLVLTREVLELRDAYLAEGILHPKWTDDATHVAAATVARADAIVSWNFKHIVRLDKMKAYNRVNLAQGYGILTIISPKEVFSDDQDQDT